MAFIRTQCEIHGYDFVVSKTSTGIIVDDHCPECEAEAPHDHTDYYAASKSSHCLHIGRYDLDDPETDDDE